MSRTALIIFILWTSIAASAQSATQQFVNAASDAHPSATVLLAKHLVTIRSNEIAEGSGITLISDATLEGFRSDTENGRFYLFIAHAIMPQMQNDLRGRALKLCKSQDAAKISSSHLTYVSQRFNRLEVPSLEGIGGVFH
jgi:hypothetical protein